MLLLYLQTIDTPEDRHKFEILYEQYKNLMFYVANKMLNNPDDAEDAVHQAFLSIAENIDKVSEPLSNMTKGYVLTITEHKAIDVIRTNNRNSGIPFDEAFVNECGLEEAVELCGDDTLSKCILKLPANYREVILLKYVHGYSLKEIAEILNITLANATKIDQRAKTKLKQMCLDEGLL